MDKELSTGDRATRYAKEIRAEFRKVIWPTRRQTAVFTLVVVVSVAVLSGLIFVADSAFNAVIHLIIPAS